MYYDGATGAFRKEASWYQRSLGFLLARGRREAGDLLERDGDTREDCGDERRGNQDQASGAEVVVGEHLASFEPLALDSSKNHGF